MQFSNVKTIYEMPLPLFDFVVDNIGNFIQQHKLNEYLYRRDIGRVINGEFDVDNEHLLREFLKSEWQPFL